MYITPGRLVLFKVFFSFDVFLAIKGDNPIRLYNHIDACLLLFIATCYRDIIT